MTVGAARGRDPHPKGPRVRRAGRQAWSQLPILNSLLAHAPEHRGDLGPASVDEAEELPKQLLAYSWRRRRVQVPVPQWTVGRERPRMQSPRGSPSLFWLIPPFRE